MRSSILNVLKVSFLRVLFFTGALLFFLEGYAGYKLLLGQPLVVLLIRGAGVFFIFTALSLLISEAIFRILRPVKLFDGKTNTVVFKSDINIPAFFGMKLLPPRKFIVLTPRYKTKAVLEHEYGHAKTWYIEMVNIFVIAITPIFLTYAPNFYQPGFFLVALLPVTLILLNEAVADKNLLICIILPILLALYSFKVQSLLGYCAVVFALGGIAMYVMNSHAAVAEKRS